MKISQIGILTLSFLIGQAYAQSADISNNDIGQEVRVESKDVVAPKGFNKISWGKAFGAVKNLKESEEADDALHQAEVFSDGLKCYEKEKEQLNINGTKMDKIVYCFANNKLVSGVYKFSGAKTSKKVKASLVDAYGEGLQYDSLINEYKWDFGMDDEVFIKVHLYFDDDNGSLVVSNERLKNNLRK